MAAKKGSKAGSGKCGCGAGTKAAKVETATHHWQMCRVTKNSRTRKPGTFAKRATCN